MRAAALLFALLVALPTALAHVPHDRAYVQALEGARVSRVAMNGTVARIDLLDTDAVRHLVSYTISPARMSFAGEERDDAPVADRNAVRARFEITRLVLFHDANQDGAWQPSTDGVLKSWRFSNYQWRVVGPRQVGVGGIAGVDDVLWEGALQGGPNVTLEVASAGRDLVDEGARARPQDVLVYLTIQNLTARPLGSLYALEGALVTPRDSLTAEERLDNLTVAVHAEQDRRRVYLDWGGTVLNERGEGNVTFAMDAPSDVGQESSSAMRWTMPLTDRSLHLLFVVAVEYPLTQARGTPDLALPVAAAALAAVALLRRRG